MTTINPYGSTAYVGLGIGQSAAKANTTSTNTQGDTSATLNTPAVNVTLSAAAQAALKAQTDSRSIDAVVSDATTMIASRLKAAGATSALKDGKATIDLSDVDRRTLFAVASDKGGKFPIEQQVVASLALKDKSDTALAGPAAQARTTGDYATLYQTAIDQMDGAGTEEKATAAWTQARAALVEGRKQAIATPGVAPQDIQGDTVATYLADNNGVVPGSKTRDFGMVATDVRSVLDKQYAAATGDTASTDGKTGTIDLSQFDDRSLAAISLNKDGQFSAHEVSQAQIETRSRDSAAIKASYQSDSSDPTAFGKAMITRYASMSDEERQAAGWTPAVYDKMVALQNTSDKLASMFNADGSVASPPSLLDYM